MNFYITKYALTQGIEKIDAEEVGDNMICHTKDGWTDYFHREGGDWHRTYESALAKATEMKTKKIASIQKQMEKLRNLKFSKP